MAIGYVLSGALLCLTIIGIPFGIQSFKLAGLALAPFGKRIVRLDNLPGGPVPRADLGGIRPDIRDPFRTDTSTA